MTPDRPPLSPAASPSPQERLESLKVGLVAAALAVAVAGTWQHFTQAYVLPHLPFALAPRPLALAPGWSLSALAIAVTGLMFGVTYRYVIRGEANIHLRSGAVAAFVLVRALAGVDGSRLSLGLSPESVDLLLRGLESLGMFGLGAGLIEAGIGAGWLQGIAPAAAPLTTPNPKENPGHPPGYPPGVGE